MRRVEEQIPGHVERVPLHARPQHQQDRVHRVTIGHPRAVGPNGCYGGGGNSGSICSHNQSGIRQPSSRPTSPMTDLLIEWHVGRRYNRFDVGYITPTGIGPKSGGKVADKVGQISSFRDRMGVDI